MCGLVGYVGKPVDGERERVLTSLLQHSTTRGRDGWGFMSYWPDPGGVDGTTVFKNSEPADKADLSADLRVLGATAVLMHTRAATSGTKLPIDCHPLVWKDIVVVHNGHVNDQSTMRTILGMPTGPEIPAVDSFLIAYILGEAPTMLAGMEKVFKTIGGSLTFLAFTPRSPLTIWAASNASWNLYQFRMGGADYFSSTREIFMNAVGKYQGTGVSYPAFKVSYPLDGVYEISPYSMKQVITEQQVKIWEDEARQTYAEWWKGHRPPQTSRTTVIDMRNLRTLNLPSVTGVDSDLTDYEKDLTEKERLGLRMRMLSRVLKSERVKPKQRRKAIKMYKQAAERLQEIDGYGADLDADPNGFTRLSDDGPSQECALCAKPAKTMYRDTPLCWGCLQSFFV